MKHFLLLMCLCIAHFAGNAKMYYYRLAGQNLNDDTKPILCVWESGYSGYAYGIDGTINLRGLQSILRDNPDKMENWVKSDLNFDSSTLSDYGFERTVCSLLTPDSNFSNSKYLVYSGIVYQYWKAGGIFEPKKVYKKKIRRDFLAVTPDMSEAITWEQGIESSNVWDKKFWELIDEKYLKTNPYDFLY